MHQRACHPFMEYQSGQGRYRSTVHGLTNENDLIDACRQLMEEYQQHFPESGFLGFAVQRSYKHIDGIAFSVGITRDPLFGPW